ncbi:hypothetical protein LEN26_001321 [Aphanomyces euteiches]|nr:hypothetical protein AeMF1_015958 [Aphanomyces euteiches]KAH9161712.1 hypothetical protein LEN26_001321 [Aphanomyces euteiches]KAH9197471.1 hypothetical protein AeNC1_000578 [Aphanomyces euteiches]
METRNPASSKATLGFATSFLQTYLARDISIALHKQAQLTRATIKNKTRVSVAQFLRRGTNLSLSILPLFSESEPDFEFYAWLFMIDWVQGLREVVSFEGDEGAVTLISTLSPLSDLQANPSEVPTNVAYLVRGLMQYITWVMLCVACVVSFYILYVRGHVEAANMTAFSRVASLVWIGRPSFSFVQ